MSEWTLDKFGTVQRIAKAKSLTHKRAEKFNEVWPHKPDKFHTELDLTLVIRGKNKKFNQKNIKCKLLRTGIGKKIMRFIKWYMVLARN